MKNFLQILALRVAVAVSAFCFLLSAFSQLTTTVSPGYQFSAGERISTDKLNRLGQPSIGIAGTVSGTVGLAAKSVTGVHLADSVVDSTNTEYNASSPRQIRIVAGGIDKRCLATNVAGAGLTGGLGTALSVRVDGSTVGLNGSGQLTLVSPAPFYTNDFAVSVTTTNINQAHGLAYRPLQLRWSLVCTTANLGYSIGDEVDAGCFSLLININSSDTVDAKLFMTGCNTTNVFLSQNVSWGSSGALQASPRLVSKLTGTPANVTLTNWKARVFAQ